jgi:N-acetylglucosaminyldiphosphoundecaprenol N-acetyl-beta-D-mannosaminyltransferase
MSSSTILGVDVDSMKIDEVLDRIHDAITAHQPMSLGVVNAAKLVNMCGDDALKEDVSSSDLVLADGMAVVWASRILGDPLPERVSGIDLMYGMMERGNEHGYRFFLLGAKEDVSEAVEKRMQELYPNAIVAGRRNGYFSDAEEEGIAQDIKASNADILLVAITSPKKERFMARWRETMNVSIVHGVGGSFDVMSGKVRRAPDLMQKLGLEWLYRVMQEPGRLAWRYLRTNTLFIAYVGRDWFSRKIGKA